MQQITKCPSCRTPHVTEYCHTCGEKKFEEKDLSIWEFYKHFFDVFFNLDSKAWRTVLWLTTRPGKLTERFLAGDRVNWVKPMQLFAIVNLIFYLVFLNVSIFFTRVDTMNEGYLDYFKGTNYFHYNLGEAINKKSLQYAVEPADLSKEIELQANNISKAFLFFLIPAWGWFIYRLFRSHTKYFVTGHVAALHSLTFYMLFALLYIKGFFLMGKVSVSDLELLPFHTVFGVYFILSLKRIYKTILWEATYKGGLGLLMFFFLISVYKQVILLFAFMMYPAESLADFVVRWFTVWILVAAIAFYLSKSGWDHFFAKVRTKKNDPQGHSTM